MIAEQDLWPVMGGSILRREIDRIPLWRAEGGAGELCHVSVKQLIEDFAQYTYLPRVRDGSVLTAAIEDGLSSLSWEIDGFAYADGWDGEKKRYRGLKAGRPVTVSVNDVALIVKPDVARTQMEAEQPAEPGAPGPGAGPGPGPRPPAPEGPEEPPKPPAKKITRFHGTVAVYPLRAGRDAGKIAEEVIKHLSGLVGAKVQLTLEVQAEVPESIPGDRQRIVNENCRTLKFNSFGFEEE
jgi:hypothetical protein